MAYITFATEKFSGILVFYVIYVSIKYHERNQNDKLKNTFPIAVET